MKSETLISCVLLLNSYCTIVNAQAIPDGPYFGQEPPGLVPEIFAPGIISIPNRLDRQCRFSYDGKECFVTISAHTDYTRQIDGKWMPFTRAPFEDGAVLDMSPCLSSDDQTLFFVSSRHLLDFDTDIYVTHRSDDSWILFHSKRSGGYGRSDLYISYHRPGDSWSTPKNLGSLINTEHREALPVLSPDGKYFFF